MVIIDTKIRKDQLKSVVFVLCFLFVIELFEYDGMTSRLNIPPFGMYCRDFRRCRIVGDLNNLGDRDGICRRYLRFYSFFAF